jgi:hypothetical protein
MDQPRTRAPDVHGHEPAAKGMGTFQNRRFRKDDKEPVIARQVEIE